MTPWARAAIAGGLALAGLAGVLAINVARLPAPAAAQAAPVLLPLDAEAAAARLAEAIRIPTVSHEDRAQIDPAQFEAFAGLLERRFPRAHGALRRERVGHSLLYAWPGADLGAPPMLLAAHFDVVPATAPAQWRHPPFGGVIEDGYVWGRGAMDDKSSLMAQLEAVERVAADGFAPRRTVYFAFGHDEEIGGEQGAQRIAALLAQRGVRLEFTLDEGGAITEGIVPGVARPVASVMAGEKGYVSLKLTVRGAGGHSSTPPPTTQIGRLARALARIEQQPMPARLIAPVGRMLRELAPQMGLATRLAIANRWLFEPLLLRQLGSGRHTNALIRSTIAPTLIQAGIKDNVLPDEAWAVVNVRLLPGDTIADAEAHLRAVIDDPAIELARQDSFGREAPPVSSTDTAAYAAIARTVGELWPQALVTSGVILATTDNRHYAAIREHGYYFLPFVYTPDDDSRIHGRDERIGVAAYGDMIRFYERLLRNTAT